MPARSLVFVITLFWLATTGWLFYQDLWPRLRPGQPPPYTIDLADEALQQRAPRTYWTIYRKDKKIGMVQTWLKYRAHDDTFELHSQVGEIDWGRIGPLSMKIQNLSDMYRVTRDGQLRDMLADVTIQVDGLGPLPRLLGKVEAHVEGEVKNERFIPHGSVRFHGDTIDLPLEPVPVSSQGNILNPLHPIGRVRGLRRGQHWQMPMVNPLNDSLMATLKKDPGAELLLQGHAGLRILQAEVLPEAKSLHWKGAEVSCLVIAYQNDALTARTWVREEDGLVLRQEFSFWGDQVVLERDPASGMP